MKVTQLELADALGIPFQRVNQIINGRRSVTPDTALRLSKVHGTSVDVWLNLQLACDLYQAMHSAKGREIERLERIVTRASS